MTTESNDYLPVMYRTRLVDVVNKNGGAGMHQSKVQLSDKNGHAQMQLRPTATTENQQPNTTTEA